MWESAWPVANTFTSFGDEILEAVSFETDNLDLHYEVSVFVDPNDAADPESGVLASRMSGTLPYPGYHTVRLDTPVGLHAGQRFSVVVNFTVESGKARYVVDISTGESTCSFVHTAGGGQSACKEDGEWQSFDCSFRIKAYTKDAVPHKEETSIALYAADRQIGSYTGAVGSLFTLPEDVPAPEGYHFAGWSESRCVDAVNPEGFYEPGQTILVDGKCSALFALFRRDFDGDTVFRLARDRFPGGNYVLTTTRDTSGDISGGAVLDYYEWKHYVFCMHALIRTEVAIDGDALTGVTEDMILYVSPEKNVRTIRHPLSGSCLAEITDFILMYGSFDPEHCLWEISPGEDGVSVIRSLSEDSAMRYIGVDPDDFILMTNEPRVYLWRQEDIYRTEPISALPHTAGDINEDGAVDARDLVRLMKCLSGNPITVNPASLDVNGDGSFTAKDLLRLLKYISGYDVEIF